MTCWIKFWGVRGSIASPGAHTQLVGGNTSCVELRLGEATFILDAGTGLRLLGDSLADSNRTHARLFLSHLHWDHIQGLPFFAPLYRGDFRLDVVGPRARRDELRAVFETQMTSPVFPVELSAVEKGMTFDTWMPGTHRMVGDVQIRSCALAHPGGAIAYRFDFAGRSVVYATDHEAGLDDGHALVALAQGADVLILDAQYLQEELDTTQRRHRRGWGHSSSTEGLSLVREAGVGTFVMYHHDPSRSDATVAAIELEARRVHPQSLAAREGTSLTLPSLVRAA